MNRHDPNRKDGPGSRQRYIKKEMDKTCYKCGKKGHLMRDCKEEAFTCDQVQTNQNSYTCTGKVNGRQVRHTV